MPRPLPDRATPALSLPLAGGGTWTLSERRPETFTMIVVYRGLHCPICRGYLKDLHGRLAAFARRGVEVVAVSSDSAERADETLASWHLEGLPLAHSLDAGTARAWGLYLSAGRGVTSMGVQEPAQFAEPGIFLVRADGRLYYASTQSMPFARPSFDDLLKAVDFALEKDYPARGELA